MGCLKTVACATVLAAAALTTGYNLNIAYRAHRVVRSEGFEEGRALLRSWDRLYGHLQEDEGLKRVTTAYLLLKGKTDGAFQHDLEDFLEHAEEFGEEHEDLVGRIDDLTAAVTFGKYPTSREEDVRQRRERRLFPAAQPASSYMY